jgi:hypothetical protein
MSKTTIKITQSGWEKFELTTEIEDEVLETIIQDIYYTLRVKPSKVNNKDK